MHQTLVRVCDSLDALQAIVLASYTDDRTLNETVGWHHPAVSRHELAAMPKAISTRLRDADVEHIDEALDHILTDVPRRLQLLHPTTVPHMFNGNGHQAIPAYTATLDCLLISLRPILGWQTLQDTKAMPAPLARRLRSIQLELDSIVPNKDDLQARIKQIEDATDAAESLPTDMEALRHSREKVQKLTKEAETDQFSINFNKNLSDKRVEEINASHAEAEKLVQQCEEAYRITTTKGLAGAFEQRANSLSKSIWVWVAGLLLALAIGAYIGAQRLLLLSTSLAAPQPEWGTIWMHAALSILSLGAPLWFAWLATKQIGQRFRLAEDYAFKASVAKAYEGYRKEAARIDEVFEARLFASALTRLEEAPLRLVEGTSHGSPWHELVSSAAFQDALKTVPELRDKFIDVAKSGLSVLRKSQPTNVAGTADIPIEK